jgi:hypothetical protein
MTLVHEAAHARIVRAGIPWWPDLFERIETRCVKEELAFCRRLQAAEWQVDARIAWTIRRLSSPLAPDPSPLRTWIGFLLFSIPGWALFNLLAWAEEERRKEQGSSTTGVDTDPPDPALHDHADAG